MTATTITDTFKSLQARMRRNFTEHFSNTALFKAVIDKDVIWSTYLESFPEENGVRQKFNCHACKSFIRQYGGIVKIENNKPISIWRFATGSALYQPAVDALATLVEYASIDSLAYFSERCLGTEKNYEYDEGKPHEWHHFYLELPPGKHICPKADLSKNIGLSRDAANVLWRGFSELSKESLTVALELIAQNSLPSGTQFKSNLELFQSLQLRFLQMPSCKEQYYFCWDTSARYPQIAKLKNQSIGQFLQYITDGMGLEDAVNKFSRDIVGATYQRPQNLTNISQRQIQDAENKIVELGLQNSLGRRLAVTEDISVNNALWVDRTTQTLEKTTIAGGIFETLKTEAKSKPKKFHNLKEVPIADFIDKVLPTAANGLEVYLDNGLSSNLVSLIAPVDLDAPVLTKWDNGYTWVYSGGMADSFKQKVKDKGGNVDGLLRNSLWWFNYDDLDLWLTEPNGHKIYYGDKNSTSGGFLDLDENADKGKTRDAVENIIYPYSANKMLEGDYLLQVHNYTQRESIDVGFKIEVECQGVLHKYKYSKLVPNRKVVSVAKYNYTKANGVKILDTFGMEVDTGEQELWGLKTNNFHKVTMVVKSPNYWDTAIGNEHIFFMLEGCENQDPLIRGFFNEQLNSKLLEHKKVFELLASKLQVAPAPSDRQLSGLGFQLTKPSSFIVKVLGASERILKVIV